MAGCIYNRGTKHAPNWWGKYKDHHGKWRAKSTGQPTREAAEKWLAAIVANVANGRVGIYEPTAEQRQRATITLDELVRRFNNEYRSPKIKDHAGYREQTESVYGCRVKEALGDREAASITSADIERLRDRLLEEGYAPKSVSWTMARISRVYVWGKKAGLLDCGSPVAGVEYPSSEHSIDFLSKLEAGQLLAHAEVANPEVYPMIATAIYAGLRKGELYGLRWSDVVFDAERIDVCRSYTAAPKSGKPRHVPIHPELARILRAWKERCPATDEGLVFPVLDGDGTYRMGIRTNMRGLSVLLKQSGCHVPKKAWHALRHTFASHFMMSGGNILTLQKLLGHSDKDGLRTTMIYAHLAKDFMATEVARMSFAVASTDVADLGEHRRRQAAISYESATVGAQE